MNKKSNAFKYIDRAGKKNPDKEIEDLEKAIWYLNRKVCSLREKKASLSDDSQI